MCYYTIKHDEGEKWHEKSHFESSMESVIILEKAASRT